MTGFQLVRPQSTTWTPARKAETIGRHASQARARLTLRRLFYIARHFAG